MNIRNYKPDDKKQVIPLWEQVFAPTAPHNDPETSIGKKEEVQDGLFFIAEEKETIIGTIMAGYDGHRGWIYSLAVAPDHRKKGIASALVNHALTELKKKNCPKVNLQIVAGNEQVIDFYKKLGFAVEERISMGKII